MKFPIHVYQSPGSYIRKGVRFKLASAADQAALDAMLADGWHLTLDEAVKAAGDDAKLNRPRSDWRTRKARDAKIRAQLMKARQQSMAAQAERKAKKPLVAEPVAEPVPVAESVDEKSPPTREEMEQQATLLGLKFDKRTSDRRLLERINEAMKGA